MADMIDKAKDSGYDEINAEAKETCFASMDTKRCEI